MGLIESIVVMILTTFLFCAMLSGLIALSKDRSWLSFTLAGLLLGPIGLLITAYAEPGGWSARIPGNEAPDIDKP